MMANKHEIRPIRDERDATSVNEASAVVRRAAARRASAATGKSLPANTAGGQVMSVESFGAAGRSEGLSCRGVMSRPAYEEGTFVTPRKAYRARYRARQGKLGRFARERAGTLRPARPGSGVELIERAKSAARGLLRAVVVEPLLHDLAVAPARDADLLDLHLGARGVRELDAVL